MIGRPEMRNCHRCGAGPFPMYIFRCGNCERLLLTPRDLQYIALVLNGDRNKEIAYKLCIKEGTVKVALSHLFNKLGVSGKTELAIWAMQWGLSPHSVADEAITHPQA